MKPCVYAENTLAQCQQEQYEKKIAELERHTKALEKELTECRVHLTLLEEDRKDYIASYELRWQSDMRAIRDWQAANSGKELTWPDHTDLCTWLLEQLDASRNSIVRLGIETAKLMESK